MITMTVAQFIALPVTAFALGQITALIINAALDRRGNRG